MPPLPTALTKRVVIGLLALSTSGAAAIALYEGNRNVAYVDPVGVVTICTGHTRTAKLGQVRTNAQCAVLLKEDVAETQAAIKRLVKGNLTQGQFDALVSFTFNVGTTNFANSTLLKHINAKKCWAAGAEFSRWDKGGGRTLPGLTKRRDYERKLWEAGCTGRDQV